MIWEASKPVASHTSSMMAPCRQGARAHGCVCGRGGGTGKVDQSANVEEMCIRTDQANPMQSEGSGCIASFEGT